MTKVAVIGAGLIGRAWSIVFARAGFDVALWDPMPLQIEAAITFIAVRLPELREAGLLAGDPSAVMERIHPIHSLGEAGRDVDDVRRALEGLPRADAFRDGEADHGGSRLHQEGALRAPSSRWRMANGRWLMAFPLTP